MKSIVTLIAASSLFAELATAQPAPRYTITDLGTLPGGTFSQATGISGNGMITGLAAAADGTQHAVIWYKGRIMDLASPGLGGPNSAAFGVSESGQALIQAEGPAKDPNNENFCAYGTGLKCLPGVWRNGVMAALPTLGGPNGTVGAINNRGEAAGMAENNHADPNCRPGVAVNGTGPQVLDFKAVIWGPGQGQIRELPPLPGDSVAMALWINDNGQAAGASGSCANTVLPPFAGGPHAVLWEKDGSVNDLGNLGGTGDPAQLGILNIAFVVNNQGQVAGASVLHGNSNIHAYRWSTETGMLDLGTLPGDLNSAGLGMNDRGDVVGASIDGSPAAGNPRPFLWQNGVMTDLNTFLPADSPFLALLLAGSINSRGEIVGFGLTSNFEVHGFLATPGSGADR